MELREHSNKNYYMHVVNKSKQMKIYEHKKQAAQVLVIWLTRQPTLLVK